MLRIKALAVLIIGLFLCASAMGQNYKFSIPKAEVIVTIEEAGSALIHYKIEFMCASGAHAIDIVDIGMPNMARHRPVSAAINGTPIPANKIKISSYVKPRGSAYEIHLGSGTIRPGQRGVFEFTAREDKMVWQDTTDPEQASFRFTPTWFGSQFVTGSTDLTLRYKLPIGKEQYPAAKEKILWHKDGQDFSAKGVMEGENVASVAWVRNVRLTGKNEFGISFPKKFVSSVKKDTIWSIFLRWFKGSKEAQIISGFVLAIIFAMAFFSNTRGTGWPLYLVLVGLGIWGMYTSVIFHLWLYPAMIVCGALTLMYRHRRKKRYFPASMSIEGGGMKRGLSAVEAAILLEVPLHKVLTMIVFGLAKKGCVKVISDSPLKIQVVGSKKSKAVRISSEGKQVRTRKYESSFIDAFNEQQHKPVEDMDLEQPFDKLIQMVVGETAGFNLKDTREYYRSIVSKAWRQVESAGQDYETGYKRVDKHLGWLMMDDGWGGRLNDYGGGYRYHPWWWYGHHHHAHTPHSLFSSQAAQASGGADTSFGDVANSIVGRMENSCTKMAAGLDSLSTTSGGGIDLSGLDTFTSNMLSEMASGSGGGGGGGGGCACAGCACACACAGGGR